jgi:hypothetical protein
MSAVKVQQRRVHTRLIQGLEVAGAELAEHAIWEQQEQRELSRVQQIANKTQIEAREFSTLLPGLDTLFNNWNARQPSLCRFFLCSESTACISFSMEDSVRRGAVKNCENLLKWGAARCTLRDVAYARNAADGEMLRREHVHV